MNILDVCIIGGGPIGLFTAFECGMFDLKFEIIEAMNNVGGQCNAFYPEKPIYDIPAHPKITGSELIQKLKEQSNRFNPNIKLNSKATNIINNEDHFIIEYESNKEIKRSFAKNIIISIGGGAYIYNKPAIENIDTYENQQVFYSVKNTEIFKNKKITIIGGGDSAIDWAIYLSDFTKKINLVHRRNEFSCLPDSLLKLNQIAKTGKIEIITPFQIHKLIEQSNKIIGVEVKNFDSEEIKAINTDYILMFLGFRSDFKFMEKWNLEMHNKSILVSNRMETSRKNIFAIGDICYYPGKLKLILSGFSESAIAVHEIYKNKHQIDGEKIMHSSSKIID